MSTSLILEKSPDVGAVPLSKPLDESVWQAWVLKGRTQDERSHAAVIKTVTWISLAALLLAAAAGLWSDLTPYSVGIRFVLSAGGIVLILQAFHTRHYAFAAVFGALVLLYNPVTPVFSFSGEWQSALVVASALPFIASLTWRNARVVTND